MSELVLTLLRLGFLALIWALVLVAVAVLRRDLRAPRDARPLVPVPVPAAPKPGKAPKPPKEKAPKAPKGGARSLVVVEGALTGTVIPLGSADVTLGRAPDSTVVLDDDYASNAHARITLVERRLGRHRHGLDERHLGRPPAHHRPDRARRRAPAQGRPHRPRAAEVIARCR